jgi:23S rRNA maturation mini-RNase III
LFKKAFPIKRKRVGYPAKNHAEWFSSGIKKSRETLKKLCSDVKLNCKPSLQIKLRRYKKVYRKVIRSAKANEIKEFIRKTDAIDRPKAIWEVINNLRGSKISKGNKNKGIILEKEGITSRDQTKVAEMFNKYFINEANNILRQEHRSDNEKIETMPNNLDHQMYLYETSSKEVLGTIRGMKNKKSCGHDKLSPYLIKQCAPAISWPLAHLINCSFYEGKFPRALKIARVVPIHKKGSMMDIANYRPISILPATSKIFEKIFEKRIKNFLESRRLLEHCCSKPCRLGRSRARQRKHSGISVHGFIEGI